MADPPRRLNAYLAAGADVAFVRGLLDTSTLRELAASVDGPLNVMLTGVEPTLPELAEAGIARATVGAGLFLAAAGALKQWAVRLQSRNLAGLGVASTLSASTPGVVTAGQL